MVRRSGSDTRRIRFEGRTNYNRRYKLDQRNNNGNKEIPDVGCYVSFGNFYVEFKTVGDNF